MRFVEVKIVEGDLKKNRQCLFGRKFPASRFCSYGHATNGGHRTTDGRSLQPRNSTQRPPVISIPTTVGEGREREGSRGRATNAMG